MVPDRIDYALRLKSGQFIGTGQNFSGCPRQAVKRKGNNYMIKKNTSYVYDLDEIVKIKCYGKDIDGITLREAVRIIIEEFPMNTPKQLSAMILRDGPPIGPLSAIRSIYKESRE